MPIDGTLSPRVRDDLIRHVSLNGPEVLTVEVERRGCRSVHAQGLLQLHSQEGRVGASWSYHEGKPKRSCHAGTHKASKLFLTQVWKEFAQLIHAAPHSTQIVVVVRLRHESFPTSSTSKIICYQGLLGNTAKS